MLTTKDDELQFRKLKESDLETLRQWRMLPEVTKYLNTDPVLTTEGQRKWYKEMQKKGNSKYWILNFKGNDVGYACLRNIDKKNRSADPGVYIADTKHRVKGLGKLVIETLQNYAFEQLDINKLYGPVLSENFAAMIIYLKNGWRIEGVLRDHIFKDKFYDVYMIALLKKDWVK